MTLSHVSYVYVVHGHTRGLGQDPGARSAADGGDEPSRRRRAGRVGQSPRVFEATQAAVVALNANGFSTARPGQT